MVIGIDIRTLMDLQYSGVPEYTFKLLTEIFKLDHDNEYRLFYNSARDISPRMPVFDFPNVKTVMTRYPNKLLNYIGFNLLGNPEIDRMLDCDIFFMPHINFIALSGKSKNILTVHDLSFLRYPEFFSGRKNFWHRLISVKRLINRFDRIVAVSENTKMDLISLCGVEAEKIKVIYSGVGEEYKQIGDDAQKMEIRNKYRLPAKFILFLGTIEPRKNIRSLIKAYAILRGQGNSDVKLVIAGGKGWKYDDVISDWQDSPYRDDILFLGYIDAKDKLALYSLASIFVYPSYYEGFGFPPLEAMASGTPVITGNSSSLPEVVGDAGVLINPHDVSDLAQSMAILVSDQGLRNRLSEKGLTRASAFTWRKTAESYLELFKELKG